MSGPEGVGGRIILKYTKKKIKTAATQPVKANNHIEMCKVLTE